MARGGLSGFAPNWLAPAGTNNTSFSTECLNTLNQIFQLFEQVEITLWTDIDDLISREDGQKLVPGEQERESLTGYAADVKRRLAYGSKLPSSDAEARMNYLKDTAMLSRLASISNVLRVGIYEPQRTAQPNVLHWTFFTFTEKARRYSELGMSIVGQAETVKKELEKVDRDLLGALRIKVVAFRPFESILRDPHDDPKQFKSLCDKFWMASIHDIAVADAYPQQDDDLNAYIIMATVIALVGAAFLTGLSFYNAEPWKGTLNDSDFYTTCQSACLQVLGIFTVMLPVSRFAPQSAWRLSWIFTLIGMVSAIAAPLIYILAPAEYARWNIPAGFIGGAALAIIVLLLMLKRKMVLTASGKEE